jgi:hypothetical protein
VVRRFPAAFGLILAVAAGIAAADRPWQTGTWGDVGTKRQIVDFGPGASPFGGGRTSSPAMRAMADVRTYVIETTELRLELQDVVAVGRRSVDAIPGAPVTFAINKNKVYVRDEDGTEHTLRVTKKIAVKAKP